MSDFREHARNHLRTAAGTYIRAGLPGRKNSTPLVTGIANGNHAFIATEDMVYLEVSSTCTPEAKGGGTMLDEVNLSHIDRLSYVKKVDPETFRKLSYKQLRNFLTEVNRLPKRGGSEPTIARILSRQISGKRLERALRESSTLRQKIIAALDIGDIFAADGTKDIDTLLTSKSGSGLVPRVDDLGLSTLHPVKRVALDRTAVHLSMGSHERAATCKLKVALLPGEFPVVHWPAEPWSGATLAARSLASHPDLSDIYSEIVLVRCTNPNEPFVAEMRQLATMFGANPSDGQLPATLADIVRDNKLLLVLCDACHLPAKGDKAHADGQASRILVDALIDAHTSGPCRLITIGRSRAMEYVLDRGGFGAAASALAAELIDALRYTGARFEDYREGVTLPGCTRCPGGNDRGQSTETR